MSKDSNGRDGAGNTERRRRGDRRSGRERREEFRYEPGKEDRRSGVERRARARGSGWDDPSSSR